MPNRTLPRQTYVSGSESRTYVGDINYYIKKHPEADKELLITGVALGLEFLHSEFANYASVNITNSMSRHEP